MAKMMIAMTINTVPYKGHRLREPKEHDELTAFIGIHIGVRQPDDAGKEPRKTTNIGFHCPAEQPPQQFEGDSYEDVAKENSQRIEWVSCRRRPSRRPRHTDSLNRAEDHHRTRAADAVA